MSNVLSRRLARIIGLTSTFCSLIVLGAFALFVVNQSKSASAQQQQSILNGGETGSGTTPVANTQTTSPSGSATHQSTLHRFVVEAASELESPFASLTSSWRSQWKIEIVTTMLALLLYGIVLRYLSRMLHVRA